MLLVMVLGIGRRQLRHFISWIIWVDSDSCIPKHRLRSCRGDDDLFIWVKLPGEIELLEQYA